jgi:hypothetical protein
MVNILLNNFPCKSLVVTQGRLPLVCVRVEFRIITSSPFSHESPWVTATHTGKALFILSMGSKELFSGGGC